MVTNDERSDRDKSEVPDLCTAPDRDQTAPPARDDEPCLCDTDFTCMADHEEADLREYVRVLLADVDLLEAKVARVEALAAHLHTDLIYRGDLLAALNGPPELEYPDLAYAVQKGGPNLDGPTALTDEPTGDAMRWTKEDDK